MNFLRVGWGIQGNESKRSYKIRRSHATSDHISSSTVTPVEFDNLTSLQLVTVSPLVHLGEVIFISTIHICNPPKVSLDKRGFLINSGVTI